MKKLLFVAPIVALCGCSLVQSSSKITLPGGVTFTLPKDATFDYMHVEMPVMSSNGVIATAELTITNGSFKMNPAVVDAATARDTALIAGTANAIGQVMGQAAAAGVKGAAKP